MFKILINVLIFSLFFCSSVFAKEPSFVSLIPAITEIMYAIDAQDMLKAVSSTCDFPQEAKKKPVIGDVFFINETLLLKIKPEYFLALDTSEFIINKYKRFGIKPVCLKFSDVNSIYDNILLLGALTQKKENAQKLVSDLKEKVNLAKKSNKNPDKKILYVISVQPFRTIGGKSFITSVIEASGNHSVTGNLDTFYPVISLEYVINQNPDIVLVDCNCSDDLYIKKFFPDSKIIKMTKEQGDIINRPSVRVHKSVEFFAQLGSK